MDARLTIRAWKDPEFRARLCEAQRAALPECPSGSPLTELGEQQLSDIIGGRLPPDYPSTGCVGPVRPTCGIVLYPIVEQR